MEFYLARAMQIGCLEENQLEILHKKEESLRYCLANWNIQALFDIAPIKDFFGIPDDELGPQANHRMRLEQKFSELHFFDRMEDRGVVSSINVPVTHSFDWVVFKNKNDINFYFQKGRKKRSLEDVALSSFVGWLMMIGGVV